MKCKALERAGNVDRIKCCVETDHIKDLISALFLYTVLTTKFNMKNKIMKNRKYWKTSLENVLEKENVTDELVEKIIGIFEMEYEYTEFESHKPSTKETNPLTQKVKSLEKEIRILQNYIEKDKKVDSVYVINEKIDFHSKLP